MKTEFYVGSYSQLRSIHFTQPIEIHLGNPNLIVGCTFDEPVTFYVEQGWQREIVVGGCNFKKGVEIVDFLDRIIDPREFLSTLQIAPNTMPQSSPASLPH